MFHTDMMLSCIRCTVVLGTQLYYVDVYKPQYICLWVQPGIFYGRGGFGKKGHNIWKVL